MEKRCKETEQLIAEVVGSVAPSKQFGLQCQRLLKMSEMSYAMSYAFVCNPNPLQPWLCYNSAEEKGLQTNCAKVLNLQADQF